MDRDGQRKLQINKQDKRQIGNTNNRQATQTTDGHYRQTTQTTHRHYKQATQTTDRHVLQTDVLQTDKQYKLQIDRYDKQTCKTVMKYRQAGKTNYR